MTHTINFGALPLVQKQQSIIKLATIITLLVVVLIGMIVGSYFITGNKNIGSSPLIGVTVIACSIMFVTYELWQFRVRLARQSAAMQRFASANGWSYVKLPQVTARNFAPPHPYLEYGAVHLLYLIEGNYAGYNFSLYTVQGALKKLQPGHTIGYETVLRLQGAIEPTVSSSNKFRIETSGAYTYINMPSYVFRQAEMEELFTAFPAFSLSELSSSPI